MGFKAVARRMLAGALCCLAVSGSMLAADTPFRTAENVSEIHITKQIPFTAVSRASESLIAKVSKNTVAAAGSAFSLEAVARRWGTKKRFVSQKRRSALTSWYHSFFRCAASDQTGAPLCPVPAGLWREQRPGNGGRPAGLTACRARRPRPGFSLLLTGDPKPGHPPPRSFRRLSEWVFFRFPVLFNAF